MKRSQSPIIRHLFILQISTLRISTWKWCSAWSHTADVNPYSFPCANHNLFYLFCFLVSNYALLIFPACIRSPRNAWACVMWPGCEQHSQLKGLEYELHFFPIFFPLLICRCQRSWKEQNPDHLTKEADCGTFEMKSCCLHHWWVYAVHSSLWKRPKVIGSTLFGVSKWQCTITQCYSCGPYQILIRFISLAAAERNSYSLKGSIPPIWVPSTLSAAQGLTDPQTGAAGTPSTSKRF